jgi:hypothetical protein
MHRLPVFALLSLAAAPIPAATGIIGIATADGQFQVNNSTVDGNANLRSGAVIQTMRGASRVNLMNGSNLILGASSQAKVMEDRLILERGMSQLTSKSAYALEASGFRVSPEPSSQIRVDAKQGQMIVSVVYGRARVSDKSGLPIARLAAGRTIGFQPKSEASGTSVMTGRVARENGRFILPDETSGLIVELTGTGLDREVGQRVRVSGTAQPSADRSTQIIEVARMNRLEGEASASPSPAPSPNPAPAPSGSAQSGGTALVVMLVGLGIVGAATGIIQGTSPQSP